MQTLNQSRLDFLRGIPPADLTPEQLIELGELEALAQSNHYVLENAE